MFRHFQLSAQPGPLPQLGDFLVNSPDDASILVISGEGRRESQRKDGEGERDRNPVPLVVHNGPLIQ
ncbi:MAG TPA: hypothetical protein VGG06_31425 [Thermoanaerobaculia bacterium]